MKVLTLCLASSILLGCAAPKYSIVAGEYGWDKRDSGGAMYSSQSMYKINSDTGETWRMTFQKGEGYQWKPIRHLPSDTE